MDWTQTLTTIIATFALLFGFIIYLMNRMDSNKRDTDRKVESSFKELEHKIDSSFKELDNKIDSFQKENNAKFEAINGRFNGLENRLTSMEAEAKNTSQRITDLKTDINQRLSNIENCVMPRKVFHFEEPDHKDEPKEN